MTNSPQISNFATTRLGLPVFRYDFGSSGPRVLILGGVHGDEIEGVTAAMALIESLSASYPYHLQVTVIPLFNPEGVLQKTRMNSAGVDLNRNLATQDWSPVIATPRYHPGPAPLSEPENKALASLLDSRQKPSFIVSLHSYKPMLNVNGDCGAFAQVLAEKTGYTIELDMGYPTPGSLGTYAGKERGIPTVTYEIERGLDLGQVVKIHPPAILEALKTLEGHS
jgi:protein MpaA